MDKSYTTRIALALGFVGAVALAGAAFGQAGGDGPPGDAPGDAPAFERAHGRPGPGGTHRGSRLRRNLVTGTMKVQTDDGFVTRRVDVGEITAVDGSTITIRRADDETVTVTATDDARIRRDGEEAEVGDLQPGDRAHLIQADGGDGFVLRGVHAVSPEAQAEREAEREAAREQRRERFREFMAEQEADAASA